jgi:hypothetical protein
MKQIYTQLKYYIGKLYFILLLRKSGLNFNNFQAMLTRASFVT